MPLIFSVDTSSSYVVLALGDEERLLKGEFVWADRSHQTRLHPLSRDFLKQAGVDLKSIAAFGVVSGPGSFTGLRIGVTAVKGFAWALKKPVVTLSALDCLAENLAGVPGWVSPVIDAKRDMVYAARYRAGKDGRPVRVGREQVVIPKEWAGVLEEGTTLLGDGVARYRDVFLNGSGKKFKAAPESSWVIQPASLWRLALKSFKRKDFVPLERLEPRYLRTPEAIENWRKRRLAK
ncbi:MAG: tRNA (adenosine(37)-N6)-threonylcarbamoyltransferase complex dimerization subunit type 1 TsaB [Candidatus Omnitrophica bacterium]|nr:tRNA (adenosine(37)-N6)-threonylcarbamoyltransferase complex dimerization subunit type 1 TsaB [Candidatus Omnitrophota bacterium]